MRYRSIKRGICKNFDKAFYRSRGEQFIWLIGLVFIAIIIGLVMGSSTGMNLIQIIKLIIDPGAFASPEIGGPLIVQFLVVVIGAIVFTSLLINAFGNWLDRRIDCYKKGDVIYDFDNHILILGANSMLLNIVKALVKEKDNKDRDIAILTTGDAEELRSLINSEIPGDIAENIYVIYGNRTRIEILNRLDADEAKSIFILGEDDEPTHDSLNLKCYAQLKKLCNNSARAIDCYMILERAATIQHYYYKKDDDSTDNLHLTVVNSLENIAQRVLVSNILDKDKLYPTLDRDGIGEDSDNYVHFIIVGMSQMAYYMATTAAHVCHFPNFDKKGIRTKITFVQKDIEQEMDFFASRYQHLMNLSYRKYINPHDSTKNREFFPDSIYIGDGGDKKGFLDVEWEFIDSGIESTEVRNYLEKISSDDSKAYVTFAFCDTRPEVNIAAAQNLPFSVYNKDIPVLVYQPGGDDVVKSASNTSVYKNLYSFGMKTDCYDSQYFDRMLSARRIKYLYDQENEGKTFVKMPSDLELLSKWYNNGQAYIYQQSNLYSANSILFKLRSISNNKDKRRLTDHEVEILSVTEHNRWNIERLLLGFRAYPLNERLKIKEILCGPDSEEKQKTKVWVKNNKNQLFIHKDIAPYEELTEQSKNYDKVIVRNITEVVKRNE